MERKLWLFYCQVIGEAYLLKFNVDYPFGKIIFDGRSELRITNNAKVKFGENVVIRSGSLSNAIGNRCRSVLYMGGVFCVGENTGMSNVAIYCTHSIHIGSYVNIGAGTMIFDTDFHSLSWKDRLNHVDVQRRKSAPVVIGDLVFIGADSIILKGVRIGDRSIIGAGSVVSRNIPSGEMWAGNPAVFIKKVD